MVIDFVRIHDGETVVGVTIAWHVLPIPELCSHNRFPMSSTSHVISFGGRTAWARNLAAPVRSFLSTETGGAVVMLAAAIAALLWANMPGHSYESFWTTELSIRLGSHGLGTDLRHWINEGMMTLFFLVVGLEAKRELDLGELRERSRLPVPVVAAHGGFPVPIVV